MAEVGGYGGHVCYSVQRVRRSRKNRSSLSTASHQVADGQGGQGRRKRQRRPYRPWGVPDRGFEPFELHLHETPLHLFESYFAESQQNHCTFAWRHNPGRILSESAETSEADSSDDGDNDRTICGRDADADAKGNRRVRFGETDQSGSPTTTQTSSNDHAREISPAESVGSTIHGDADAESHVSNHGEDYVKESAKNVEDTKKSPYISEDDLFKDRWFPDPWNRPPGQMWTNMIQNQHNLRAAIKEAGFTGARLDWLFNQLVDRKRYRFPYIEKYSVKMPNQSQAEYMRALKQCREEELAHANQVKEYDEERALEECKWALELYNKVYGVDWPENAVAKTPNSSGNTVDPDGIDSEYEEEEEEEEPSPKRQKTRQHTSTPEPSEEEGIPALGPGISDPGLGQRASALEIEKSDKAFRTHKAEVMQSGRKEREAADMKEFMHFAVHRNFSNGYTEPWKSLASVKTARVTTRTIGGISTEY
ncbi:hypothetical protein EPUS_07063 [Endocarpon pusillum Z07020]|uniref:Uncharacterized protein n=1 Tax=Endocarpon pusillum (strain Z07020 / HMAS-L-300199) TaxID=1263415 RepID=U1FY23_ENDPU|nr:uncharacterized protein EPUS_07063 [Endocarpon pusillum Z07020]ERF69807.1 hypothetical protein EPUS_07063 [Endocarpon pusillum Z07020]